MSEDMVLAKSKRSAFILSVITVLSFTFTNAIVTMLIPYLLTGDVSRIIQNPERLNNPADIFGLVTILLIMLLILAAVGAFWLYRFFGEQYYGIRGAVRWALFGAFFALLMQTPGLLFSNLNRTLVYLWQFLSLFVAFFLTRWLVPIRGS